MIHKFGAIYRVDTYSQEGLYSKNSNKPVVGAKKSDSIPDMYEGPDSVTGGGASWG